MPSPRPITILQLSDLQFGKNHRFSHSSPSATGDSFDSLFTRLQTDLEWLRTRKEITPDLLAVTGDLAEWGLKSEFDAVFTFLERMAGFLGLQRDRVLVVPGNHDVNRSACASYFSDCDADERKPQEPYWPKWKHYAGFFRRYYEGFRDISFTEEEPWTLFELPALKAVVVGLNSTIKESHRKEDHYGWLGEPQLHWFAQRLRPYKERGWLRIGLVHHNVQRRARDDEENLRDSDDLKRILGGELNLLLHGHTHEGRIEWLGARCPILATGSASVVPSALPPEVPNQYQVIRLLPDRLWYGSRQYAPDRKCWIGDTRVSRDGDQWFHEEPIAFEHVGGTFGSSSAQEAARTDHLAAVVESYRSHIATAYRRQTLHDLGTHAEDQDTAGGVNLLEIFIPQAVSLSLPPKDLPRALEYEAAWESIPSDEEHSLEVPWEESPPLPIEQVLLDPSRPWILLLGSPGAGKTLLTRWLCLKLCTPGESLPNLPSDLVPVRVEMRRFDERYRAATASGRTYDFFDYLDQEHAERAIALRGAPLRELGPQGRLLWLFDGIDEVSERPFRKRYAEMIVGLRAAQPSRGVITSRIVGVQPVLPYFQSVEIPVCVLLDFDEPRIQAFLQRWHDKAFHATAEARITRRERLERVIAESRPVRDLCRSPLLLTLIALINRGGELPRRRHELYRRAVELMVARWEANKQLPSNPVLHFEFSDKAEFLRELAWWMLLEGPEAPHTLIREEALLEFTSQFLTTRHGKSAEQARDHAEVLIAHLRERNYILARVGGNFFGFVHKTFLEYFAADAIRSRFASRQVDLEWLGNLFRLLWRDESWQEVMTLVCGMLDEDRPENVMEILQAILPHLETFHTDQLNFCGFAVRCLAEVRQLDREPLRTFMRSLAEFSQYEMHHARYIQSSAGFAESIHLIGPRWPDRESWQKWARKLRPPLTVPRALARWCALDTAPAAHHGEFLIEILRDEWNAFVAYQVLTRASLPEDRLLALLLEGEPGVRCAIATGLLYSGSGVGLHQGRLTETAMVTLKELLVGSPVPIVRIRAAAALAKHAPTPQVREVLLECIRNPSSLPLEIAESIRALGHFAKTDDELATELRSVPSLRANIGLLPAAADALMLAGRSVEAAQCRLEWVEHVPRPLHLSAEEYLLPSVTYDPRVYALMEKIRAEGKTEILQQLASRVCEEAVLRRQLRDLVGAPASQILEVLAAPSTSPFLRQRILWQLTYGSLTGAEDERILESEGFLGILADMGAAGSAPISRLTAAITRWNLGLEADKNALLNVCLEIIQAQTADEKTRLLAARWLGEEGQPVIELLALLATDESVRFQAKVALPALKLRASIQAVGKQPV